MPHASNTHEPDTAAGGGGTHPPTPSASTSRRAGRFTGRERALIAGLVLVLAANVYIELWGVPAWPVGDGPRTGAAAVSAATPRMAAPHNRPIIRRDGQTLLWARDDPDNDSTEWFDVTDARVDPRTFQYGIGRDRIAAIDDPEFVPADDPRLRELGYGDDTIVLGYAHNGDARAYPVTILDHHELVNDTVGGKPVTVGW